MNLIQNFAKEAMRLLIDPSRSIHCRFARPACDSVIQSLTVSQTPKVVEIPCASPIS
jgi:hypothetical protein